MKYKSQLNVINMKTS